MSMVSIPKNVLPEIFEHFPEPLLLQTIIFVKPVDIFEELRHFLSGLITCSATTVAYGHIIIKYILSCALEIAVFAILKDEYLQHWSSVIDFEINR